MTAFLITMAVFFGLRALLLAAKLSSEAGAPDVLSMLISIGMTLWAICLLAGIF